jgi:HEAT repeat protein
MKNIENYTTNLLGDGVSVQSLIQDLRGLNSYIKLTGASGSSGSINKSTVEHLIKKLDDTDPDVRVDAVKALGWKKDKRSVEPLIKKLKWLCYAKKCIHRMKRGKL